MGQQIYRRRFDLRIAGFDLHPREVQGDKPVPRHLGAEGIELRLEWVQKVKAPCPALDHTAHDQSCRRGLDGVIVAGKDCRSHKVHGRLEAHFCEWRRVGVNADAVEWLVSTFERLSQTRYHINEATMETALLCAGLGPNELNKQSQ